MSDSHATLDRPSAWVCRFAPLIAAGGEVLDLACGGGRNARHLVALGLRVQAVDRDEAGLRMLAGVSGVSTRCADLEGAPWPYGDRMFDGVVATNYLHRPLLPLLVACLREGGVLLYETFMVGNERYGRPSNPEFLLRPGELLDVTGNALSVIAFEQGQVEQPKPSVVQRICAVRASDPGRFRLPA